MDGDGAGGQRFAPPKVTGLPWVSLVLAHGR
jgi:hypothetical protein